MGPWRATLSWCRMNRKSEPIGRARARAAAGALRRGGVAGDAFGASPRRSPCPCRTPGAGAGGREGRPFAAVSARCRLPACAGSGRQAARLHGEGRVRCPCSGAKGEVSARIFSVAYTLDQEAGDRPITFVFNGGPGAASAFLHLGAMGPRAVNFTANGAAALQPVALADNPDAWLDFTDLVFVDPVATGYSRSAARHRGGGQSLLRRREGCRRDGRFRAPLPSRGPDVRCRRCSWRARATAASGWRCSRTGSSAKAPP